MSVRSVDQVLAEIEALPPSWPSAGPLQPKVLTVIVRYVGTKPVLHSLETGTGRSTLLLSHLSQDHKVFTTDAHTDDSLVLVQSSPLLNRAAVEFIEGPTQRTLPGFHFASPLQLVLIDGPHGYPFPDLEYYYLYPHLDEGALLILDDIHIPTIFNLFAFLKEDAMFELLEVVGTTSFFRRTKAPLFDPMGDDWVLQNYNINRFPLSGFPQWGTFRQRVRSMVPISVKKRLKRLLPAGLRRRVGKWMVS